MAGNCHNKARNRLEETSMLKSPQEGGKQQTWLEVCDETSADDNVNIVYLGTFS